MEIKSIKLSKKFANPCFRQILYTRVYSEFGKLIILENKCVDHYMSDNLK